MVHLCDDDVDKKLIYGYIMGTEMIVLLVALMIEIVVLGYIIYHLIFTCKREKKTKLQPIFRILVLIYHISLFACLVMFALVTILIIF